jgi:hypothetical protein
LVWARRLIVAVGTALSALLVARSQVGGDQLNLLARGWLLVTQGHLVPYGNPLSTGGKAPGAITTLLMALPLTVWRDHRAVSALILLSHVLAYWILDRTVRTALQPHERLLLAVFYWLSPWRLYFSAFIWNPNFLFLAGALHLASAAALRVRPRWGASCLHVATLIFALQLHPSALILVVASAVLAIRRAVRFHWGGVALGIVIGNLTLLPWYGEVLAHPGLLAEAHKGFLGRGLVVVFPLLRGLLYWLRYGSLSMAGRMDLFDFTEVLGSSANRWLKPPFFVISQVLSWLTVVAALIANVWLLRRRVAYAAPSTDAPGRYWLRTYVGLTLAAMVVILCLSPTTFMYWQGLCLVHAAVLPLVLWGGAVWRSRWRRTAVVSCLAYTALEVSIGLGMAFGSPDYRCLGKDSLVFNLRDHSPMFDELHLQSTCAWPLDQPGGWWPDVLPETKPSPVRDIAPPAQP